MYKNKLKKINIEINFSIEFVFNQMIDEELSDMLKSISISYEIDNKLQ